MVRTGLAFLAAVTGPALVATTPKLVREAMFPGGFPLVASNQAASLQVDPEDAAVVDHAAADLAADILAVTGVRPRRVAAPALAGAQHVVLIGTLGHSRAIDALAASGRLDARQLRGAWESFLIAVVRNPLPGVESALVIAGSDRRGTAFGIYELSQAIGVSPWSWWADVPPERHTALWLAPGTHRFGPPSVKYRGIFINDEDWGLHPWAAKTFEPAAGGIGPKTYERVFELLLRLKANTLWPAMHKVSKPFNADPQNARLADRYAIVMGSSHAEPMLRDNVGEWKDAHERFNYALNPAGVRAYWEERVKTNAGYESLWTLGMRGIHDGSVMGADTIPAKVALLTQVIGDQRAMLRADVNPDITRVPQMFMPYKEVLDIYRGGLRVPDDVTIIWPDDNFGYIRQFPDAAERARSGGSGIYYHLSYLGAPLSYLWLSTTAPALVMEEMTRSWDLGTRKVWIANVGDIKPAETDISLFMEMAWDIDRWRGKSQREFLDDWAGRTFGQGLASMIGGVLDSYYSLNFERRPEHLQWWLPGQPSRPSPLSDEQVRARLARFEGLRSSIGQIEPRLSTAQVDAFYELVKYPVLASADANLRYFAAERYVKLIDDDPIAARSAAAAAADADSRIKAMTRTFNEDVAGGKWRYILSEEPADGQWRQFRIEPPVIAAPGLRDRQDMPLIPAGKKDACATMLAPPGKASGWVTHAGLGRSGNALVAAASGATLEFDFDGPQGCRPALSLLPTFPSEGSHGFVLQVSLDGGATTTIDLPRQAETPTWGGAVLDNRLLVPLPMPLTSGRHRVKLSTDRSGLVLDGLLMRAPEPSAGRRG
jgi:hypothetical protein